MSDVEAQRKKILNRLRRARGQLDGVIAAIESGTPCVEVVTQLSATKSAIDRAGFVILATSMECCIAKGDEEFLGSHKLTRDELEKMFLMIS